MKQEEVLDLLAKLNRTQREIIYWKIQGLTSKKIGQQMRFSRSTIDNYFTEICETLGVKDLEREHRAIELGRMFGAFDYDFIVNLVDLVANDPVGKQSERRWALRPAKLGELPVIRSIEEDAFPDAVRSGDICFEPEQIRNLIQRFPQSFMFLEDDSHIPYGHLCSYPVPLEIATRVINTSFQGKTINLPGTRSNTQLFTSNDALLIDEAESKNGYAWYIDSIALVRGSPYRLLYMIEAAEAFLQSWLPHIGLIFTISDRTDGERLAAFGNDRFPKYGFRSFRKHPAWTYQHNFSSPQDWKCWAWLR